MDNLLLQASVLELRREILGLPVHRIVPAGSTRFTLLLGRDGADRQRRLMLDLDLPLIYLTRRRTGRPSPPTPFQGLLGRELDGAVLIEVEKPRWERVVRLELQGGRPDAIRRRALVAELFGNRANLLLVGDDETVLGFHRHGSGAVGEAYRAPAAGGRLDPEGLDEATLRAKFAEPVNGLGRRLWRGVLGMSPALGEEIERQVTSGEDPWEAFRDWRERSLIGRVEPCLYTGDQRTEPILTPFPISVPPGTGERRFSSVSEAVEAFRDCVDARRTLGDRRASLAAEIARKRARLERLIERLEGDLSRGDEAAELSRQASVLLAGLAHAEVEGGRARVPDPFDPTGRSVTLEIDPRISLKDNADRLFHRARKARRGRTTVARRLEETRVSLAELRKAGGRVNEALTTEDVERLEAELARAGILRLVRRAASRRAARPAAQVLPVRSFLSADGMEILIGRTGKENDLVTFKVASPHDFWFHAQGHAGAHVVVRNPQRLKRLPGATLEQAARLAAFHSKARGSGRVEVMFTLRRHVKKGRNLPAGTVRVRRHESVQVPPTMPFPV